MSEAKGAINVYHCGSCGRDRVTINLDAGVTPMYLRCDQCGGQSVSRWYRVDQTLMPEYAWYRPHNLRGFDAAMRDHIERGGLDLRKIESEDRP